MGRLTTLTLLAMFILAGSAVGDPAPERRILVDAKVNGKPVKLCFDTGCDLGLVLFRSTVERLGIRSGRDSKVRATFSVPGVGEATGAVRVLDLAGLAAFDGLLGWRSVGAPVLELDAEALSVSFLQELPDGVDEWEAFPVLAEHTVLCIRCSDRGGRIQKVFFDSGLEGSLLSKTRFRALRREFPDLPATLTGGYSPAAGGTYVSELVLAPTLSFGLLKLDHLIVTESAFVSEQFGGHEAVLGMEALRRFEIVIDRRGGKVYMKSREGPFETPEYNRMGAVFVPKTLEHDELVAHVLPESPAARAGLRSGDVLLAVDGRDYTRWRENPEVISKHRVAEQPAGTRHVFTVTRGDRKLEIAVVLEDILALPKEAEGEK